MTYLPVDVALVGAIGVSAILDGLGVLYETSSLLGWVFALWCIVIYAEVISPSRILFNK